MASSRYTIAGQLAADLISLELTSSGHAEKIWHAQTALREEIKKLPIDEILSLAEHLPFHETQTAYWDCITELHNRPEKALFENCARWATDFSAKKRPIAADVLAQLGHFKGKPFANESWPVLKPLLKDQNPDVVRSALCACGHLGIGDATLLAHYATNPNRDIRRAAVHALSGKDDPAAIEALIILSRDSDLDIRNWSTFNLAQISTVDTNSVRQALFDRLEEPDPEIRGEALIGLAKRGDLRVLEPLKLELSGEFHGAWCIEAAQYLALPAFDVFPAWTSGTNGRRRFEDIWRGIGPGHLRM